MIVDTCFLIDLQRELKKREKGNAVNFLKKFTNTRFCISSVTVVEFLEGWEDFKRAQPILDPYKIIPFDDQIAREAAVIRKDLRKHRQLICDFDICIAATSLHTGQPLVTRNISHFKRIKKLEWLDYSDK